MRIWYILVLSSIICYGDVLKIPQVTKAIRHHAIQAILKQVDSDDLTLCVASDSIPLIYTRISLEPVVIDTPPDSLRRVVKVYKGLSLCIRCGYRAPIHVTGGPGMKI
jgi:hypothetical protein